MAPLSLLYSIVPELIVAVMVTLSNVPPVQLATIPVMLGFGFTVTSIAAVAVLLWQANPFSVDTVVLLYQVVWVKTPGL